jgi:pimeloyl-ACP methyl ester carboxylesterase/GNAT superfamily N-acetyltransferase
MVLRILDLTADRPDLVDAAARLLHDAFGGQARGWPDFHSARKEVVESLNDGKISRVALDEPGAVVGWIGSMPSYGGKVWEIHPLVVAAASRRHGVGRALVQDLEEIVRRKGAVTLWAGSDDEDCETSLGGVDLYADIPAAIRGVQNLSAHPYEFYLRLGFTIVGVMPDANGLGKPDIFLAKRVIDDRRDPMPLNTPKAPVAISRDGVSIAYETKGRGQPALVFIHGWSCDRSHWAGQLQPLSSEFKVVAVDLGGHGDSGLGRRAWTIESFGEDVAAVVDALGLERVILIGHSMGGDVVMEAARRLKDRVVGIVWLDTYKQLGEGRNAEEVRTFIARLGENFIDSTREFVRSMFLPTADSALVERVATDMSSAPPAVALGALESAFSYSRKITRTVTELRVPVIAINSDNAPTDLESMRRCGVEVMLMPGVGHFLHMEDPDRFNGLLRTAIDRLIDGSA